MTEFELRRSRRRSISMEITDDLRVIVRAPLWMDREEVERFVSDHEKWLEKHMAVCRARWERERIWEQSPERLEELKRQAEEYLPARVKYYADRMGVEPSGVRITSARKRFGSCSGRNSLCFSFRLMAYPPEAVDYVVAHELAHIVHKDHSRAFYSLIEQYLPDYRKRIELLKK